MIRRLIAHWWYGDEPWQDGDPSPASLGIVSPHWLLQCQQQARVEFHGVAWTWPVMTTPRLDTAPGCGDRAPSAAATCVHTGPA